VNPTEDPLPTNPGNTATDRQTWQTHFRREQLRFRDRLRHTTYHWVAHLLTEHPTRIYHPTFGLTPILECDNFTENVTIPRKTLDEVILIPSATVCDNCKATCSLIQRIELERAESQALEEYILLTLDTPISPFTTDPIINTPENGIPQHSTRSELFQQPEQPQQPLSGETTTESHGTSFSSTATTGDIRACNAGRNPSTYDPESTSISGTASLTAAESRPPGNTVAGAAFSQRTAPDPLYSSSPRRIYSPIDPAETSWEIRGRTIYSI
jgi:hypothetical protein